MERIGPAGGGVHVVAHAREAAGEHVAVRRVVVHHEESAFEHGSVRGIVPGGHDITNAGRHRDRFRVHARAARREQILLHEREPCVRRRADLFKVGVEVSEAAVPRKFGEQFRVADDVIHGRAQFVIHAVLIGALLCVVFVVEVIFDESEERASAGVNAL